MLSLFPKFIPLIPLDERPLKVLNFFDSKRIHFPSLVLNIISWFSLQILTPIILSSVSSFIAIFPDVFIEEKSSKLFFLIFPLLVAKTICMFLISVSLSGKGIIELIDWWFLRGRILKSDLPLDIVEPSGIFHALTL